jgi:hypothetical protein
VNVNDDGGGENVKHEKILYAVLSIVYGTIWHYWHRIGKSDFFPRQIDESISIADFFPPN